MPARTIREGFHTLTPYLIAEGASRLIEFIGAAFAGKVTLRKDRPDGSLMHCEMQVGNSMLMLGDATAEFGPMPASLYLYVNDCDAVYRSALDAGGVSVFPMMTLPSGERYGGLKDPCGNIWWVATHLEDVSAEEEDRRWKEFTMP